MAIVFLIADDLRLAMGKGVMPVRMVGNSSSYPKILKGRALPVAS